jgi:hypothetical protein
VQAYGQQATQAARPDDGPFDCPKERDPLFSFCSDINLFFKKVANSKKVTGTVDRNDSEIFAPLRTILTMITSPDRFTALQTQVAFQAAVQKTLSSGANQLRLDQQSGAGKVSGGTTTLVEKAGAPGILAFALESGAVTGSVSGNTTTLIGNADGIVRAISGQQVLCFECKDTLGTKVLQNVNLSATFLIDQQSSSSTATSGPANSSTPSSVTEVTIPTHIGKLSNLTARYELWNHFDPHNSQFQAAWTEATHKAADQISKKATSLQLSLDDLLDQPAKEKIVKDISALGESYKPLFYADAENNDLASFRKHFMDYYRAMVDLWRRDDPQFDQHVADVNLSLAEYRALWQQILDEARGHPLLTFEYSYNRPPDQPETHDFRLVWGYAPKSALGMVSVNAAISIYGGTLPAGAKYGRLHDGQIAAQYDRPFRVKSNPNQVALSLAAYWQYQPSPSVLNITAGNLAPGTNIDLPGNAQVLLGTSGSLWVTQAKFTINGHSGIKVPVAVRWANKTDLLSGNKFGAQVGISYDFSSLSSLFGGSAGQ